MEKELKLIEDNIELIIENQRKTLILVDNIENEQEELRKQLFILANIISKLKQEIDNGKM